MHWIAKLDFLDWTYKWAFMVILHYGKICPKYAIFWNQTIFSCALKPTSLMELFTIVSTDYYQGGECNQGNLVRQRINRVYLFLSITKSFCLIQPAGFVHVLFIDIYKK